MKAIHYFMICLSALLISILGCTTAAARSSIDHLVKELEDKGVDVNTVIRRNSKTKQIYLIVKDVSFISKDGNYARRLQQAFDKEGEDATNYTTNKHKGNFDSCIIYKQNKKSMVYSLSINGNKSQPIVSVSIVIRDKSVPSENDDSWVPGLDNLGSLNSLIWSGKGFEAFNDMNFSNLDELKNYDWSKFSKQMKQAEKQIEDAKGQIEDATKQLKDIKLHPENYQEDTRNGVKIIKRKK